MGDNVDSDEEEFDDRRLEDYYILKDVLGTGGFSTVHRALCIEDGTEVAIKTLKKLGSQSVSNALVENEIMVMNRIVEKVTPHPNVIRLYDVFEDEGGVHLILELCCGGELFDRIVQQERYSEAGAAAVVRQIARGLYDLHEANISHRDLKPENCLFLTPAENSPLKIMDFGLSHIDGETSPLVGLFGSLDYVAPESLEKREVQAAGDMWSLGVILYILLCGQVFINPFALIRPAAEMLKATDSQSPQAVALQSRDGDGTAEGPRAPVSYGSSNGTSVTLLEFEDVLRAVGMGGLVPVAARIYELFDGDNNGSVDMREIMYDADDSGSISREEMAQMLRPRNSN
eukprot:jgi/Mesen1/2221/ME000152S01303